MRGWVVGAALMAALVATKAEAQLISGQVDDAGSGQPLSAVQVFISDLDVGVLSEGNGAFRLDNVPPGTHLLEAERLGYASASQEVTVVEGQPTRVDFQLEPAALSLDAVVVTGTAGGSQVRAVGNVVENIDVAGLVSDAAVQSVEDALTGRVAGLQMLGSPNSAGDAAQIRIRGTSSVGLAGDPIIYIDGVRMNSERGQVARYSAMSRLNDIDPRDIASIEVIKGPAAATLYGTEAANGVIQIVTKRGEIGATVFDFTSEAGTMWLPSSKISTFYTPDPSRCSSLPCESVDDLIAVNYAEREKSIGNPALFEHGLTQRYSLSLRGGTDLLRYSASFNRSSQDGVVDWNYDKRTGVRANLQVNATDELSIVLNGAYSEGENAPPGAFWGQNFAWGGAPATILNTEEENRTSSRRRGFASPPEQYDTSLHSELTETRRSTWSLELNHQTFPWLAHRLVGGIDQVQEVFTELDTRQGPNAVFWGQDGRFGQKDVEQTYLPVTTLDFSGTATFRFNEDQIGSATSYGVQYYHTEAQYTRATGENFSIGTLSTVGAAAQTTGDETFVENTTLGIYLQNQFDWQNRIFLTGAVRADDNSAFGEDFDAAIYPKVSTTWVVHEEEFWDVDWLSQFRLRGAWGAAGQQPDAFAATRLYSPETGPNGEPMLTPSSYGNPDLGPERGEELELGFDAELWDGRLGLNFTYFDRVTKDALIARTVPPSLWPGQAGDFAGATQLVNAGEISSSGTETSLSFQAIQDGPVQWDLNLAFTTLGNQIEDLGESERIQVGRSRAHYEGFPIAAVSDKRVVSAEFVDGDRGQVTNIMCDGGAGKRGLEFGGAPVPCDDAPRLVWGQSEPSWLANLTSTWSIFDNWRVTANVDAQGGHWMSSDYLGARHSSFPSSRLVNLQDNPIGMAYLSVTRNGLTFHEAGFAKLREIALTYTLPEQLYSRVGANRASVTVGGRNLATLWQAQEFVERERVVDPEMSRPDNQFGGESGGDWPPLRQWSVRVNVSF